jgi:DNA repair exonuclease SbcCD ATPase subunit
MLDLLDRVSSVETAISEYERYVSAEVTRAQMVAKKGKELQKNVLQLKENMAIYADVATLLLSFSEIEQRAVQDKFEQLISYALQLIFGDKFKQFRLNSSVERGQVSMTPILVFNVDGVEISSEVIGSHGGGPSEVVSFVLKLLVLIFSGKDKVRPVLFLDETFSRLSEEYLPAMVNVIRKLVDELGADLQIVLVSHQREVFSQVADVVYKFDLNKAGYTVAERVV